MVLARTSSHIHIYMAVRHFAKPLVRQTWNFWRARPFQHSLHLLLSHAGEHLPWIIQCLTLLPPMKNVRLHMYCILMLGVHKCLTSSISLLSRPGGKIFSIKITKLLKLFWWTSSSSTIHHLSWISLKRLCQIVFVTSLLQDQVQSTLPTWETCWLSCVIVGLNRIINMSSAEN